MTPAPLPPWMSFSVAGKVQPIVPAVTAVLAGLVISVSASSGSPNTTPGPYVVALPPSPAPAPASPMGALALLPPSVAAVTAASALEVAPTPVDETPASVPTPETPAAAEPSRDAGRAPDAVEETGPPRLDHVFLITLSDQPAERTYAPDGPAPYLARTLTRRGVLLPNHFAVTRGGLANTMAMLSGQGPTPETQAGCPVHSSFVTPPGTESPGADGQEIGSGCVRTPLSGTLPDQLRGNDRDWAAYAEGMADGGPGVATSCRRPAPETPDDTLVGRPADAYATARNPLVFFGSIVADAEACAARDRDLDTLADDLERQGENFPAFAYIAPSPLRSGTDTPYVPGQPAGGLAAADAFLKETVETIERSKAYADGGLIVITTDQAPEVPATGVTGTSGPGGPTGAMGPTGTTGPEAGCCLRPDYPNVPAGLPGGGRVGLLLLSEDLADPGSMAADPTNHFDLLRSLQDAFGLAPLGYAAREEVTGLPLASLLKPADG